MRNDGATPERLKEARRRALARLLADERGGLDAPPSIGRRPPGVLAPLSFAQEVIWLFDRAHTGSSAYNSPLTLRIQGPFDGSAFEVAVTALAERHEALRTVVDTSEEQPRQRVLPPTLVPLVVHDVRTLPEASREPAALAALRKVAQTPFSLTMEAPLRIAAARTGDDAWILLLLTHHFVSDAWSYAILFRELEALYTAELAGERASLPPVERGFGDFATWQRATIRGDRLERGLAYWRGQLAAAPVLDLVTDRPSPAVPTFAGASCERIVEGAALAGLRAVCERTGSTLYTVLLAAFTTLLHRYTGQDDIIVGSAVAGRAQRGTEDIVGYFSGALPMRTRFDGDPPFDALLERVRDTVLGAIEHQEVPFESLAQAAADPNRAAAPLFRTVLTMQDASAFPSRLGLAEVQVVELDSGATKFDLTLLATDRGDRLGLVLWYRTDLFAAATAARLLGHFCRLLESIAGDPAQRVSTLELLRADERAQLEESGAPVGRSFTLVPVAAQIAGAARRKPQALAVVCGPRRLSYAALESAVAALAERLRHAGVGHGTLVGLVLEPSAEAIVALLAVWRAGGAYVPLAVDGPRTRREQQIAVARLRFIVSSRALAAGLTDGGRVIVCVDDDSAGLLDATSEPPEPLATLDDLAYVMFTSGSTGEPKGVAVTVRNLAHYTAAISERLMLGDEPLRFATVSSLAADLGNTAIFPALCSGGVLHIIPPEVATEPEKFAALLAAEPVDVLKITPSHFGALCAGGPPAGLLPRRWLVLGGEPCPWPLVEEILATARCRVLNHYGPTEATVGACTFLVGERLLGDVATATVPIGLPLTGVRARVLDANGRLVAVGVAGELYLGGPGVAAGYLYRDDLTAERFSADPFAEPGSRRYRTGDRVRRLPTGELEFLGRLDAQVKIRGYRVELGEIESAIVTDPSIAQAVAVYSRPPGGDARLVVYVVPREPARSQSDPAPRIAAALAQRFPDYMLPSAVIVLERLPLTSNGKLDRAALPDPRAVGRQADVAPRTPTEAAIASIWADIFGLEAVGVDDDFLAMGGHSILAIRLLGKLSRRFGVKLSLRALFEAATVARLAEIIDRPDTEATVLPQLRTAPSKRSQEV